MSKKTIRRKVIRTCKPLHTNTYRGSTTYPVFIGHRGKTKRKRPEKKCFTCGADAGLLSITLPSNRFLRPRTEAEEKAFAELVQTKTLSENDVRMDQMHRKIRLCPQHIKPLQKQFGPENVQMWGQK